MLAVQSTQRGSLLGLRPMAHYDLDMRSLNSQACLIKGQHRC